jgi:hypothetical protein
VVNEEIARFLTGEEGKPTRHLMAWQMALALAPCPDDFDVIDVAYRFADNFIARAVAEMDKEAEARVESHHQNLARMVDVEIQRRAKADRSSND